MATIAELDDLYPTYLWRYTALTARAKHAISKPIGSGAADVYPHKSAICGISPVWFGQGWLGTGNQEEYERNDRLVECKRCINRLTLGSQTTVIRAAQKANAATDPETTVRFAEDPGQSPG